MWKRQWLREASAVVLGAFWASTSGCGGDARMELAAADAVESQAAALQTALGEYHAEVEAADDERQSAVIAAFVLRMQQDGAEQETAEGHAAQFEEALGRLRVDRQVEWARYHAAWEHTTALEEVAQGLRRVAIESMTLQDEARRYVYSLIETVRASDKTQGAQG